MALFEPSLPPSVDALAVDYWKQEAKSHKQLRAEFAILLDEDCNEQTYQTFMERNTRLIPREFVQNHGIHFNLVLRKLSIGADYKCDFCFLTKSSGLWNCVLIEIEKPSSRFFSGRTNKRHSEFDAALGQIDTWRAYLDDMTNHAYLTDQVLGSLRRPMGYNPVRFKYVLVHGRRSEFESNTDRKRLVIAAERDDFRIRTFDSLMEDLHFKNELYLGVRHNAFIDIRSDLFLDETIFSRMPPEQIRITSRMKANAEAARHQWFHQRMTAGGPKLVMGHALPFVGVSDDDAKA